MILDEFLDKVDRTEIIYLGCKDGSSFFQICTAALLRRKLNEINRHEMSRVTGLILEHSIKIASYPRNLADLDQKIKQARELLKIAESAGEENKINGLMRTIEKTKDAQKRLGKNVLSAIKLRDAQYERLKSWKHLGRREVIETYPHTFEVPGTTVLIDGDIVGKYWSLEEVKKEGRKK